MTVDVMALGGFVGWAPLLPYDSSDVVHDISKILCLRFFTAATQGMCG